MKKLVVQFSILVMFASAGAACGDDDGGSVRNTSSSVEAGSGVAVCDPFGDATNADTTINATLREYSVELETTTMPAGKIHFAIENAGAEAHEFLVIRADSVDGLPTNELGKLDEDALADGAFIDEVGAFPAGETCDGTFDLAAGNYLAICNIAEEVDGKSLVHLKEGMVVPFVVS